MADMFITPLPISAAPLDGTQVLIGGMSGYHNPHAYHVETAHWNTSKSRWENDSGDAYSDSWPTPTIYYKLEEF